MAISATTTYEILPLEDVTLAVEVAGNSTANKANARLWNRNDSNSQKWLFEASGTSGVWYIKDAETGKCLEVFGGTANDANGANVSMYTANQSVAQRWQAIRVGSQAVNGTSYETYQFVAFGGTTSTARCMDVQGDGSYIRSNIQIWSRVASHPSQTFVLVPTEWNAIGGTGNEQTILAVPASGTVGASVGTESDMVSAMASGTLYPAWTCDEALYQVRYRTRTRAAGETALGAWSDWKSISDGATTFGGWGAVGASNCTPTDIGGVKWSPYGVAIDNTGTDDLTEVEFSSRAWVADWGVGSTASAHGGAATWSATAIRPVTLSTPTATMAPDGLTISWDTDWTRGGNAIDISSTLFGSVHVVGGADGSATIPIASLASVPDDGDSIGLTLTFTTSDGLATAYGGTVEVSYESGHGSTMTLTAAVDGTLATVTASDATASAWLVIPRGHGNRFVALANDGTGAFNVVPPLGVPWTVYAAVETQSGWESTVETFPAIDDGNYHVTSQDTRTDLAIIGGVNKPQQFAPSYTRSSESAETYNRERPVNVLGGVTSASWTLKGAALSGTWDACDWALHAGHVYFRSPDGFWAQAAITGGSIDRSNPEYAEVELSCAEEVW